MEKRLTLQQLQNFSINNVVNFVIIRSDYYSFSTSSSGEPLKTGFIEAIIFTQAVEACRRRTRVGRIGFERISNWLDLLKPVEATGADEWWPNEGEPAGAGE